MPPAGTKRAADPDARKTGRSKTGSSKADGTKSEVAKADHGETASARARRGGKTVGKGVEAEDLTLTDRAYRQLEELIATLQLPPGTVLSELTLAQRLNIGRTPIREALQRLARDGLVVVLARRGVLVSEINLRTQLRLLETRRVLERLMAQLAAERASDEECEQFAQLAEGMRDAAERSDGIAFMRLDRALNTLVSDAARNEFASRSMGLMHALSRRFWYQHYKRVADLPLAAQLHADLAAAIAARDATRAGDASDKLIDYIESFARKTLDD